MVFQRYPSALLAAALTLGAAAPALAGGHKNCLCHRDRYVAVPVTVVPATVVPAPTTRVRVIERTTVREVVRTVAAPALSASPQTANRALPAAQVPAKVVPVDRTIGAAEPQAQARATDDEETRALRSLQENVSESLRNPSLNSRAYGQDTGGINDRDLEPVTSREYEAASYVVREAAPVTERVVIREVAPVTERVVIREAAPVTERVVIREAAPTADVRAVLVRPKHKWCLK